MPFPDSSDSKMHTLHWEVIKQQWKRREGAGKRLLLNLRLIALGFNDGVSHLVFLASKPRCTEVTPSSLRNSGAGVEPLSVCELCPALHHTHLLQPVPWPSTCTSGFPAGFEGKEKKKGNPFWTCTNSSEELSQQGMRGRR